MLSCRGCQKASLELLLDFGDQPLAGYFPKSPEKSLSVKKYRMRLYCCIKCGLIQIHDRPPIEEIFNDDYVYATGEIKPLVAHFEEYSEFIESAVVAGGRGLEFGCNDGTLLRYLRNKGFDVSGVDASSNMVERCRDAGLDVVCGFFPDAAENVNRESFDFITCSNVFAHIHDLDSLSKEAFRILKNGGKFFIEVHDASELLPNQFDTIYHEHLSYFDEYSISRHLELCGFGDVFVEKTKMHGGGLRVVACKDEVSLATSMPSFGNCRYLEYSAQARVLKDKIIELNSWIEEKCKNRKVDIYGAAGRAQMFVNETELIGLISHVYDDAPIRQGRFLSGTNKMIEEYSQSVGDICIITAWNYSKEIFSKIRNNYSEVWVLLPKIARLVD